MPVARPPLPAQTPAPIDPDDAAFIKDAVSQFYGPDAFVRTYGPNPSRLQLHVETSREPGMEQYDCMGVLFTRIERERVDLVVSKRGSRLRGSAKIAYRQGVVL
jgi:hypothetical protein